MRRLAAGAALIGLLAGCSQAGPSATPSPTQTPDLSTMKDACRRWQQAFAAGSDLQFERVLGEAVDLAAEAARQDGERDNLFAAMERYEQNYRIDTDLPGFEESMDEAMRGLQQVRRECRKAGVRIATAISPPTQEESALAEYEPPYAPPDPATLWQIIRGLFAEYLEREPKRSELERLTADFQAIHRQAWDSGGDAEARFREHFLSQYQAEMDVRQQQEESVQQRETMRQSFRCMDAYSTGERPPDYC